MTSVELVPAGTNAIALAGLELPSTPPARIYISGHLYKIAAPRVPLPPLINAMKAVLNWVGPAGRIAKNIWHVLMSGGTGSTSDPTFLSSVANEIMTAIGSATFAGGISSAWTLNSIDVHDLGGTSSTGHSTLPAYPGGVTGGSCPPGTAVVMSWQIAGSYRGGKPRTYLPGVPLNFLTPLGSSQLDPTYSAGVANSGNAIMNHINSHPILGSTLTFGTVSYFHGHTVRPVPQFVPFLACHVHERVDSQRRRNGKEAGFPTTP